jgi:hypothetical protein
MLVNQLCYVPLTLTSRGECFVTGRVACVNGLALNLQYFVKSQYLFAFLLSQS